MKKFFISLFIRLLILIILILVLSVNLFSEIGRQNSSTYFNAAASTQVIITVSSTTYSASSLENGLKGVDRWFRNEGENDIYFQRGGMPETVLTNGMTLRSGEILIDDTYFGDYYFQTKSGSSELAMAVLTKR
jgi:hypothetical protein